MRLYSTLLVVLLVEHSKESLLFHNNPDHQEAIDLNGIEQPTTKQPLFGKTGKLHAKIEQIRADLATKPPLFGENGTLHKNIEKIVTDLKTKPLVDQEVNVHVKVLHSELDVSGSITLGGHQTGAHLSSHAKVLGQEAGFNGNLLNGGHHQVESGGDGGEVVVDQQQKASVGDKIKNFFHHKKEEVTPEPVQPNFR